MTNPDNIVRVRARNGGRASVYEANGWAQAYSSGLLEGNGVVRNTSADMNVLVGGSASKPDVVLAENPAGYKIALDLVGQQPVAITAPATNSRISAIVAYTDDLALASSEDSITGSPASCGLIVVNGTAAANPSNPTDNQIRAAITADGATGSQAAYCVIATILVANDTTVITNSLITSNVAGMSSKNLDFAHFTTATYSNEIVPGASNPWFFTLTRCGNVVVMNITSVQSGAQSGADDVNTGTWNTIPDGYKPINQSNIAALNGAIIPFHRIVGDTASPALGQWRIGSNGKFYLSTPGWSAVTQRFGGSTTWITTDEWPS